MCNRSLYHPLTPFGVQIIFMVSRGSVASRLHPCLCSDVPLGLQIPLACCSPNADLSMIAGLHQRAWGNSNFSCIIRRAAECKLPVPELSDTGRKCYSIACLGDLSRRRFTEDGSLGEDGSIVDSQSSITFGGGGVLPGPSAPSVSESRLARFLRRDRAG